MKFLCAVLFLYVMLPDSGNCARILCVLPTPSYSHQIVYEPVWQELVNRGHDVVVMTPLPPNETSKPNLRIIDWSASNKLLKDFMDSLSSPPSGLFFNYHMWRLAELTYDMQLSHPDVQQIINNSTEHFDLVMIEWYYPLMTAFGEIFKCPTIGISSMPTHIFMLDAIGQPAHPVYNPDFIVPAVRDLNLLERVQSSLVATWLRFVYNAFVIPGVNRKVKKHFGKNMRSVSDIEKDVSLLLMNSNHAFNTIRPNMPNVININNLHLKPNKILPQEYQSYLDAATEGVVYFSLGSNVKSSSLPIYELKLILDALSELPYKVLWKWNGEELSDKPNNINASKWMPQQEILAHPNVKLFITQGGMQSLEEAIYYKVPIIGMPFFTDQHHNVQTMVENGLGLMIEHGSMDKESLKNAMLEVATNKRYKDNILKMADITLDVPLKSLDLAIWWIEYAVRNNGAKHLRSPLLDVPWYEYYLLDVFVILLTAAIVLYKIVNKSSKLIFRFSKTFIFTSRVCQNHTRELKKNK